MCLIRYRTGTHIEPNVFIWWYLCSDGVRSNLLRKTESPYVSVNSYLNSESVEIIRKLVHINHCPIILKQATAVLTFLIPLKSQIVDNTAIDCSTDCIPCSLPIVEKGNE